MSWAQVQALEPDAAAAGVSKVARGDGFTRAYERYRTPAKMAKEEHSPGTTWAKWRDMFIRRTLPLYRKNPTPRRRLALAMWAYDA